MADNGYNFTGIEDVLIPVTSIERTQSFLYKARIKRGDNGSTFTYLIDGLSASNVGMRIAILGSTFSVVANRNKIQVLLSRVPASSQIQVYSSLNIFTDIWYDIEIEYDGSGLASGVSITVDGQLDPSPDLAVDTLSGSILNTDQYVFGRYNANVSTPNPIVFDSMEFTVDGNLEFDTNCENNDPNCINVSGAAGNGTVSRSTSTEEEFYISISDYGEKYKYFFNWDNNSANTRYKVSILKFGYNSTVTTLTPTSTPWLLDIKGQLDTFEKPILGSSAKFEVITEGPVYTDYDDDFLNSNYKDFIVKLIEDPDGTPIIRWVGILQPEIANRNWVGYVKTYSLSAVDGLADLKNKKYSTDGTDSGSTYNGFDNMLSIIKKALGKVADISELQLNFRIQLGTYSDQMTDIENAFEENEIAQELFFESDEGETKFDSCYDVLQKILAPFYCNMAQSDGFYWIWCNGEDDSYYFEYNWALALQSRTNHIRSVNISDYKNIGQGSLYKTGPYKDFNVRLYNKNYDPELVTNGGFTSNITGWTNGDADDSSNGFSSISYYDYPAIGGTLKALWAGAATSGNYHFHSSGFTLVVGAGEQDVNVSIRLELNSSNPSGVGFHTVEMRLWNSTDGYVVGNRGDQIIFNEGGFETFSDTFSVTALAGTNNFLDIELTFPDASTTEATYYFDEISVKQGSENVPVDWLYIGSRTTQLIIKEQIVYIADQQESDNDICAIKDVGGSYTNTWDRFIKTGDDIPLIQTLQQYTFNSNRRYMSYTKGTMYDPDETIETFNVLSNDDSDFRIIGMQKDYYHARVKLDLIEVVFSILFIADTSFNAASSKLGTQYGDDIV